MEEPIFLQGGVASPNAQTTGGAAQETSKEAGSNYEFNKNIYKF